MRAREPVPHVRFSLPQVLLGQEVDVAFLLKQLQSNSRFMRQVALWYVGRHALLMDPDVHRLVAKLAKHDLVGDVRMEAKNLLRSCRTTMSAKAVEVLEDGLAEEEAHLGAVLRNASSTISRSGVGVVGPWSWPGGCFPGNWAGDR